MRLHRPLPTEGSVEATASVVSILDKGPGRNAIIELAAEAADATTGDLLAETRSTVVLRGGGGFGGATGSRPTRPAWPERSPDAVVSQQVRPDQSLLYRLSGDRNPLHSDPWFARERGGFPAPILHGLCTYGFAGRALLSEVCGGDDARFAEMAASFAAPVFPGETLTTKIWRISETEALFQSFAKSADSEWRLVLDGGRLGVNRTVS